MSHVKPLAFLLCLLVLVPSTVLAQAARITGRVLDTSGQPITGARVVQKGTLNSVLTRADGTFELSNRARIILGAANLLNAYPTQQDTETETGGLWDAVQMGSAGTFVFAKLNFRL